MHGFGHVAVVILYWIYLEMLAYREIDWRGIS